MSLSLSDLRIRVAVNIQDGTMSGGVFTPAYSHWPVASIDGWINDAVRQVTSGVLLKQRVAFMLNPNPVLGTNATAEYVPDPSTANSATPIAPTPTNLFRINSLVVGTYPLAPKGSEELQDMYYDWDTRMGTAQWFNYNEWSPGILKLVLDPGEALTTVRGIATLKPVLLSDGDTPPFDSEYHDLCELYATARAFMMDGETEDQTKAAMWMSQYKDRRKELKAFIAANATAATDDMGCEKF